MDLGRYFRPVRRRRGRSDFISGLRLPCCGATEPSQLHPTLSKKVQSRAQVRLHALVASSEVIPAADVGANVARVTSGFSEVS